MISTWGYLLALAVHCHGSGHYLISPAKIEATAGSVQYFFISRNYRHSSLVFGAPSERLCIRLKTQGGSKAKKEFLRWTDVTQSCAAICAAVQETPGRWERAAGFIVDNKRLDSSRL